jgi:HEAT repeat protein
MFILLVGCAGQLGTAPSQAAPQTEEMNGITQALIDLLNRRDKIKLAAEDSTDTSLDQIKRLGTPAGYRLKLRYLNFGISLVEALKVSRDPELRRRLIELVQWSRDPEVRAEAITTLASFFDPSHKKFLKESLLDSKVGIRFAAVEALQLWGQPEAIPMLQQTMLRDWSPLMRVFAAQAVLSMGDKNGLQVLYKELDNESWVVRAMAARYIGDYGKPDDYELLVRYLRRETKNDYVIAELAISSLKLISKKGEKVSYSPFTPGWNDNAEVKYAMGRDKVIEVEPLVVVPPRLRIPRSLQIAADINNQLLNLIKNRLDAKLDPIQQADPSLQDLNAMVTGTGFALKARYSEISYLVIEGHAGTTDGVLKSELENLARVHPEKANGSNPLIRATAILALSYERDPFVLNLIQDGLSDKNEIVRFGCMEAIEAGHFDSALPSLYAIATADPSPALRIYALQVLARFGDPSGRQMMLTHLNDPDWPARAMTYWFLGRYGEPSDYGMIMARLAVEENPFVKSEIALAALRLAPLE